MFQELKELKPVFGGFETRLKFIKFGLRSFVCFTNFSFILQERVSRLHLGSLHSLRH